MKILAKVTIWHWLSWVVTMGINGGSGGARTPDNIQCSCGNSEAASHIASQETVTVGHDLARIVTAWSKLPPALKAAILAIIGSATNDEGK
jgi:hypothetical protein